MLGTFCASIACANQGETKPIDIYRAIEVANQTIVARGVDRASVEVACASWHDLPHNELVPRKPTTAFQKALSRKLSGRTYWYVCFRTPTAEMGGDYGVFIDEISGDVIDFYMGR
jgi:hypothetical protein